MKAFVKSVFLFLLLLLGAGEFSFGVTPADTFAPAVPGEHRASVQEGNDKAVAVEQLLLTAPEVSLHQQKDHSLNGSDFWAGLASESTALLTTLNLQYLTLCERITPSLSRLDLIFPFHLFP